MAELCYGLEKFITWLKLYLIVGALGISKAVD